MTHSVNQPPGSVDATGSNSDDLFVTGITDQAASADAASLDAASLDVTAADAKLENGGSKNIQHDVLQESPSQPDKSIEAAIEGQSVGAQLSHARVALSLSLADIATDTRISRANLSALECDDYERLPAQPFLNGYIRSYAERVELDAEQLLAELHGVELTVTDKDGKSVSDGDVSVGATHNSVSDTQTIVDCAVSNSSLSGERKNTTGDKNTVWSAGPGVDARPKWWRLSSLVLLPLLCISVLAWAYHVIEDQLTAPPGGAALEVNSQADPLGPLASVAVTAQVADADVNDQANKFIALNNSPTDLPLIASAVVSAADNSAASVLLISADTQAQEPFLTQESDMLADSVANEGVAATLSTETANDVLNTEANNPQSEALIAPTQSSALAVATKSLTDGRQVNASPGAAAMVAQYQQRDRLVILVREDSWIDVKDSSGNRLFRDLARAGKKIDVSGKLPFSLHLGNAPALALELNGKPFAIPSYRDDNSARFTLGGAQFAARIETDGG